MDNTEWFTGVPPYVEGKHYWVVLGPHRDAMKLDVVAADDYKVRVMQRITPVYAYAHFLGCSADIFLEDYPDMRWLPIDKPVFKS